MTERNIKTKLKLLVAYNIGEVIDLIMISLGQTTSKVNEVILHLARYNDINRNARVGRYSEEEILVEMNRLRLAIMDFIDSSKPEELNLNLVANSLLDENKFNDIIEKKVSTIEFHGMLEDEIIKSETLEFNWRKYFISDKGQTGTNIDHLISAIHFLQTKYGIKVSEFENLQSQKLIEELLFSTETLRSSPRTKDISWDVSVKQAKASYPNDMETFFLCLHETIEMLVKEN